MVFFFGGGVPWDREATSRSAWTQKVQLYGDFPLALSDMKLPSQWTSRGLRGPIQHPTIPCKLRHLWPTINIASVLSACSLGFWEHSPLFGIKDCQTKVERMHIYYVLQPTSVQLWASHVPPFETISQFHPKPRSSVFRGNATKQIDGAISLHTLGNVPTRWVSIQASPKIDQGVLRHFYPPPLGHRLTKPCGATVFALVAHDSTECRTVRT